MDKNVIVWKLNELMAVKRVRNKDLAEAIGITENSVYRLRKTDRMPRLTPDRLNSICTYLECQPGDLLKWIPDTQPSPQLIEKAPNRNDDSFQITEEESNLSKPKSDKEQIFKVNLKSA